MTEESSVSNSPFRQQALEYITTAQPLENFIQNPGFSAWTLLMGLSLSIFALIIWFFSGSILIQQTGKGMMLSEHDAIVYVSALNNLKIAPKMTVFVSLSTQGQGLGKQISAEVVSVDNLPVSPAQALDTLQNQSLVDYFFAKGPVISLQVQTDEKITPGTLIDAHIHLRRQTPWEILITRHSHV